MKNGKNMITKNVSFFDQFFQPKIIV